MSISKFIKSGIVVILLLSSIIASAQYPINYDVAFFTNAGSGDFAPYYIASNQHGIITQKSDALLRLNAWQPMDTTKRFSYGFGLDLLGGYTADATYQRYNKATESFYTHDEAPARAWIQQLYGEIKYRSVFLTLGLKQHQSAMLNNQLTSGDLIESGNARPIPELRAGFIDFVDIPFTNGWIQIQGEISYGRTTDTKWLENHYNYYNHFISTGAWYTYKRAYFRTNPSERFSVTFGAQAAGQFSGKTTFYNNGDVRKTDDRKLQIRHFFNMFIPKTGEEGFVLGNHLGSWDLMARYRMKNDDELKAYFQWPWEDGSGIGKLNGFDGLWGIEYRSSRRGFVNGVVLEYLDFTNQSGPLHWDPEDNPGTTITEENHTDGGDNYYNNMNYNGYAHYGMSIGSPFLASPLYNRDGYLAYIDNRVRGFHVGLMGTISKWVDYRIMGSYRKGWGTGLLPRATPVDDTSMMVEALYRVPSVQGLNIKAQVAFDKGSMYGDTFGALLSVSYNGIFNLGKK